MDYPSFKCRHIAAVPSFPSVPAPLRPRAMCEAAQPPSQNSVLVSTKRLNKVHCCTVRKNRTTRQELNQKARVSKKPANTSFVLRLKFAGQFSSALKQEVAPLPQQPAESQGFNTQGFLCKVPFYFSFPIFQYNQKLIS